MARAMTTADVRHDGNIFNMLRLVLASSVIFSHAFILNGNVDPSEAVLPFAVSRLAVLLFFTLSGFLVTNSLLHRGVGQYVLARCLRLLPGLWVMLLVTSVIACAAFGTYPFADMLLDPSAWKYISMNALLIGRSYGIDGVFPANPLAGVMNGSLWTIPREVQCYIVLGLVGATGLLAKRQFVLLAFIAGVIVDLLVPRDAVAILTDLRPLVISFFAGVALYIWRDKVYLSWPLAAGALVLLALIPVGPTKLVAAQLTFAYVVLVLAIMVPQSWKRISARMPDYSFGIYIYAFPVQQAMIATGIGAAPYANIASTLAVVLPLAALSWHIVEKPALALKDRAIRRQRLRSTTP